MFNCAQTTGRHRNKHLQKKHEANVSITAVSMMKTQFYFMLYNFVNYLRLTFKLLNVNLLT